MRNNEPRFVAKDVCDILGTRTDHIKQIAGKKRVMSIDPHTVGDNGRGHGKDILLVNEAGLYKLVLAGRKKEAEGVDSHDRPDGSVLGWLQNRTLFPEYCEVAQVVDFQRLRLFLVNFSLIFALYVYKKTCHIGSIHKTTTTTKGETTMLERHVEGEPEEFARLRGKIVTLCDIEHFNKNMKILKENARKCGDNMQTALWVWERASCPDLTTPSGWREYCRVYNYEMNIEN